MVSKQFYQDIDMVNIGQLIGARHQNVNNADMTAMVTLLGSNNKGLVVWNTDQNKEFVWNGTSFIPHETIQNASTTQAGVVQLNDNINSTSTTQAATANAVKKAYDIGNNKVPLSGGTMSGILNANALGVNNASNTTGSGISLYDGANGGMPSYGLAFSGTATFGTHGSVVGDWATYFTMSGATNRGWIFKSGNGAGGNVASISATGEITASSILSSGNITAFSDARLKDNITKIPDALNKLNQLKGVTYTRKDLATNTQYAGLIAQDVQKVLPEAVAVTENDIIAVDYNGVIGLLVEAIKELNNRIDRLERI